MHVTVVSSALFRTADIGTFLSKGRRRDMIHLTFPAFGTLEFSHMRGKRFKYRVWRRELRLSGKRLRFREWQQVRKKGYGYTAMLALEVPCLTFGAVPALTYFLFGRPVQHYFRQLKTTWCRVDFLSNACLQFRGVEVKGVLTPKDDNEIVGVAVEHENSTFICCASR